MSRISPSRRLRRLRSMLAILAGATALLVAAACRLETSARLGAVVGVGFCLVVWLFVLEVEGRLAERLELRGPRRWGARPRASGGQRSPGRHDRRRRAA